MRFDLKKPCPQCPFSRAAGGFLSEERTRDIVETFLHDNLTFTCHKHISGHHQVDPETGEEDQSSDYCPGGTDQHCAGAMALYDKLEGQRTDEGRFVANQMLQIAARLGIRDPARLDPASLDMVYDSADEMVKAHANNNPRTKEPQHG